MEFVELPRARPFFAPKFKPPAAPVVLLLLKAKPVTGAAGVVGVVLLLTGKDGVVDVFGVVVWKEKLVAGAVVAGVVVVWKEKLVAGAVVVVAVMPAVALLVLD